VKVESIIFAAGTGVGINGLSPLSSAIKPLHEQPVSISRTMLSSTTSLTVSLLAGLPRARALAELWCLLA
jgi:hypothetical protein